MWLSILISSFSRMKREEFIEPSKAPLLTNILNIINMAIDLRSVGTLKLIAFTLNNIPRLLALAAMTL